MTRFRPAQMAGGGAATGQALVWDGSFWVPGSPSDSTKIALATIDAKGDLLLGTADNTVSRLAVGANGTILTADSTQATGVRWGTAPVTGISIQDENGTAITGVTQLDFQGAGVTATSGTGEVVVTIPGGSGTGGHTIQDEGVSLTARTKLNFVGAGVTVTDSSGTDTSTVTIPGSSGGGGGGTAAYSGAGVRLTAATATQGIPSVTFTHIDWETELWDTDGYWSAANPKRMTVPVAGKYLVTATVGDEDTTTTETIVGFAVNAETGAPLDTTWQRFATGQAKGRTNTQVLDLAAGDYVTVVYYQARGGTNHLNNRCQFTISLLSGGSSSSSSGSSSALYGVRVAGTTTQSIANNTFTPVTLTTPVRDDGTFYSAGAPTRFTVPSGADGWYVVTGLLDYAAASGGTFRYAGIYVNGAEIKFNNSLGGSTAGSASVNTEVTAVCYLVAGDYVELQAYQNKGSAAALQNRYFSMGKLGGGGSGTGGHTVMDEGVALTARTNLDFAGTGVTVTDVAGSNKTLVTIPGSSGGGTGAIAGLLDLVFVNPTPGGATYTSNTTAGKVVDSTNLKVTFVAPSNGKVLLRFIARLGSTTTAQPAYFFVTTSSTGTTPHQNLYGYINNVTSGTNGVAEYTSEFPVTGLTAGQTYTFYLGWSQASTNTWTIYTGEGGYGPAIFSAETIGIGGGSAVNYRGAWQATSTYAVGDIVTTGGATYIATVPQAASSTTPTFVQSSDSGNTVGGATFTAHGSGAAGNQQLIFVTTHQTVMPDTPTGWALQTSATSTHDRLTVFSRLLSAGNLAASITLTWADKGRAVLRTYAAPTSTLVITSGSGLITDGLFVSGLLVRAWGSAGSNVGSSPPSDTLTADAALTNRTGPAVYDWFQGVVVGDDPTASGLTASGRTATNTANKATYPQWMSVMIVPSAAFSATGWDVIASSSGPSTRANFVATAGQTSFLLGSTPVGTVAVYRNGVLQSTANYSLIGATLTLNTAALVNDDIAVIYGNLATSTTAGAQPSPDDPPTTPNADDEEFNRDNVTTLPSAWTWVNQGTATYLERYGAGTITVPSQAGGSPYNLRPIVRTVSSSSAWEYRAKFNRSSMSTANYNAVALGLRESGTGKMFTTWFDTRGAFWISWNSTSSYNGESAKYAIYSGSEVYLAIRKNSATSYDLGISADGRAYSYVLNQNIPSFLTGTIDQIMLLIFTESANGAQSGAVEWFRKVA